MVRIIALAPYLVFLCVVVHPYFKILRQTQRYGGGRVQYSTREFLAVSLGLIPTAAMTAWQVQEQWLLDSRSTDIWAAIGTFLFWGVNQIAGILIMLMTGLAPSRRHGTSEDSSGMIFIGALVGLTLPVMGWLMILLNLNERAKNLMHEPRNTEQKAQRRRKFRKGLRRNDSATSA